MRCNRLRRIMEKDAPDVNRKRFNRIRVFDRANENPAAASRVSPVSHAVARAVGQQAIVYPTRTSANDVICRCVMSLPGKRDPLICMVPPRVRWCQLATRYHGATAATGTPGSVDPSTRHVPRSGERRRHELPTSQEIVSKATSHFTLCFS